MDITEPLLEMEHRFWEAVTDADFYREHTTDDAVMVFPYAVGAMDKAAFMYAISANTEPWTDYEFTKVHVVELGDDSAVITYRATASRANDDEPFRAFISSVYVKGDGAWKLAFHQQTLDSV